MISKRAFLKGIKKEPFQDLYWSHVKLFGI